MVSMTFFLSQLTVSASIWGTSGMEELTGNRTSVLNGGGVDATSLWADDGNPLNGYEFSISWEITQTQNDHWLYTYTLNAPLKEISHFILEVTEDDFPFNIYDETTGPYVCPKKYTSDSGNSNPLLPNDIYGIKFDFGGNEVTYKIETDRAPVYGVFYAKDGVNNLQPDSSGKKPDNKEKIVAWSNALNNPDYQINEDLTISDFIVRPNGNPTEPVATPLPSALVLFASGLFVLTRFRKKI